MSAGGGSPGGPAIRAPLALFSNFVRQFRRFAATDSPGLTSSTTPKEVIDMLNSVSLIGNLGSDPRLEFDGTAKTARFTLFNTVLWKDGKNQIQERTTL